MNPSFTYRVSLAMHIIQTHRFTVLYLNIPRQKMLTKIVQEWLPYLVEFLDRAPGRVFKLFQF